MRTWVLWWTLLLPSVALAQVEELENPGTVSAVQERKYRMQHELSLGVGVLPLDAFYKGLTAQVAYTYHFTDYFAWQVGRGAYSYNVSTGLRQQLERDFSVLPTAFEEVNWMVGSDLVWSPLYGKSSWLNNSVAHFEGWLLLGATVLKLTGGEGKLGGFRPAVNLGIGFRLFMSKHVSLRLDVTNNIVILDRVFNVPTLQLAGALNLGATE